MFGLSKCERALSKIASLRCISTTKSATEAEYLNSIYDIAACKEISCYFIGKELHKSFGCRWTNAFLILLKKFDGCPAQSSPYLQHKNFAEICGSSVFCYTHEDTKKYISMIQEAKKLNWDFHGFMDDLSSTINMKFPSLVN